MRIAMCQMFSKSGSVANNIERIRTGLNRARNRKADVVIFPESATFGYPPFGFLNPDCRQLIQYNENSVLEMAELTKKMTAVIGYVRQNGSRYFNSAAVLQNGKYLGSYDKRKMVIPINEQLYFTKGRKQFRFSLGNLSFWVSICQDLWHEDEKTIEKIKRTSQAILSINASDHNFEERKALMANRAKRIGVPLFYVNATGRYNGRSMVIDSNGKVIFVASEKEEELIVYDLS